MAALVDLGDGFRRPVLAQDDQRRVAGTQVDQ
jgi:hypothetical protein